MDDNNNFKNKKEALKKYFDPDTKKSYRKLGIILALAAVLLPLFGFIFNVSILHHSYSQDYAPVGILFFIPCTVLLILSACFFFSSSKGIKRIRILAIILAVIISFTCVIRQAHGRPGKETLYGFLSVKGKDMFIKFAAN